MCRDRLLSPARSRPARHASEGCYGSRRWHEAGHGPRRSLQRRSRSACPRLARKHRDRNPQRDSSVTIYPLGAKAIIEPDAANVTGALEAGCVGVQADPWNGIDEHVPVAEIEVEILSPHGDRARVE